MPLLSVFYLLALAIAFIASLRTFRVDSPPYLKLFSIFFETAFCGELLSDFLRYRSASASGTTYFVYLFNSRIFQTVSLLQYTIVAYFFIKTLKTKAFIVLSWVFIGAYFLAAVLFVATNTQNWRAASPIWSLLTLVLTIVFFYEIRWKGNRQLTYTEFPEYWINLSLLLFAALNIASSIFAASVSSIARVMIFDTTRWLEIAVLLLLARGFWRQRKDTTFMLHRQMAGGVLS